MRQAESYSLLVDTAWQLPVSPCYFIDAGACLPDAIAGFIDEVLRQPDSGHRRREKHDSFTGDSRRF